MWRLRASWSIFKWLLMGAPLGGLCCKNRWEVVKNSWASWRIACGPALKMVPLEELIEKLDEECMDNWLEAAEEAFEIAEEGDGWIECYKDDCEYKALKRCVLVAKAAKQFVKVHGQWIQFNSDAATASLFASLEAKRYVNGELVEG